MEESLLVKLDGVCRDYRVKLLTARSYGLIGYLRVEPFDLNSFLTSLLALLHDCSLTLHLCINCLMRQGSTLP